MLALAKRFEKSETGATSFEYGLVATGIALAMIISAGAHGEQLKTAVAKLWSQSITAGDQGVRFQNGIEVIEMSAHHAA